MTPCKASVIKAASTACDDVRRISGYKRKAHSDVEVVTHSARCLLVGSELFIYPTVKLKNCQAFFSTVDHIELKVKRD